ncbi:hypothetical protein ASPWEDRAFT_45416 [Aspergillus wentii DTO 134E9]|uniref:AB hydrolase-1 domain-containing protein n=1 Tax=Aspergillus wentii DTO 134E9 TaxID=1073089 RepID=A0A1L9R988_ASPWE|nr:uncharacterized protein ASPWEDRAFT_45416 [Aspergillus wentii DTO 134E9]KAI9926481.1 hypothetical protein MW887_004246 [Aspergillus wentii]OJJ31480.1 hypothetical protein ASPWEDRAFT_45416 [Aspergillus wentii DTO 134E9]
MASIAFPHNSKSLTLSTSHSYTYVFFPASKPSCPTILFLHGFPSSCYDWRHQIAYFARHGYGVLAPDLLGYGDTSKPSATREYTCKNMAAEIVELLDHERLTQVHAVAHDIGCMLLSRLGNYFPNRLLTCAFLAVPYSKPGGHFDLDEVNKLTKQLLGFEKFGYLSFFVSDRAGILLDNHIDSFFTLFYPANPELSIKHVGPSGAMEAWLQNDTQGPLAPYINEEERIIHREIMQGQYSSALNWYRALVWNLNEEEELQADLNPNLTVPVLMISPQPSPVELPGIGEQMRCIADKVVVKEVSTTGHWMQLEAREEVNEILAEFFDKCTP